MDYQQGQPRQQLTLYSTCLDDMAPQDNTVRLIDTFMDQLDMKALGFQSLPWQGRPPYKPADLLKLYIYGYMNRMRSSRRLESECMRNIEGIWLPERPQKMVNAHQELGYYPGSVTYDPCPSGQKGMKKGAYFK